ncbi:hypothetical protein DL546_006644 [Coniochaeta pulveracea]|uniref:Uncharacterized protein n=1 Tax=Coniochaeta pulveracea TaxID=177199 RepID=A0A420Y7Q7_9PEZI|nr:hypothetical protein DL546_006644 [Coniochaeta pulveracea]
MASATTSIPRFLLPQTSRLWARYRVSPNSQSVLIRYASSSSTGGSKPLVLEKPTRFNPPSHGARLPKNKATPTHYGGDLGFEEKQAQKVKDYPGLPAPEGTWAHWFWNSRAFHLVVTMGTLTSLAVFTFVQNFKQTSPFAHMMPAASDFIYHPIDTAGQIVEIIRLSEAHNSAIVAEKRKRRVDDVEKRNEYRKAHGLPDTRGFFGGSSTPKTDDAVLPEAPIDGTTVEESAQPRKKFLGIF